MGVQLQLETTGVCNAACVFCTYPAVGPRKPMSMSLYYKIVDEASTIEHVSELCLTGLGEPTLDPMLVERVQYARNLLPSMPIGVYTNGVYMSPARFDALRDAGISYVVFSLNAVNPEQHEAQMGLKGKYDVTVSNIKHAIGNRGSVHVEVRAVVGSGAWTANDAAEFYCRWGSADNGGYGRLIYEGNWAGGNRTERKFKPNEACGRALGQIYVLVDGRVTTCCFDPSGAQVFGDLNKQSVREVYNSGPYVEFREAHFNNKADRYGICAGCSRI